MSRKSKSRRRKNYIKKLKKIQAIRENQTRENQTREGLYYDIPLDPVLYFVRIKK